MIVDIEKEEIASRLKGSLFEFSRMFYPLLTGRKFIISNPFGREPHIITICKALTRVARLEISSNRLLISVPPGHGKSTMMIMWVAWTLAKYPDSKYLYISYSSSLAAKHTETIKRIISLPHYKYLFDVSIRHDSRGKEFFQTTAGGAVAAFGSSGSIVGTDAGLPGLDRFSGAVILDDMIKVDEAHSETIRASVTNNYRETIQQRARGINVPFISIGQRVHESDLSAYLLSGADGYAWEHVKLQSIDEAGNALYPEAFPLEMLRIKQERDPYVFSSQMQQEPVPSGGALFKPEWFVLLDEEPKILTSFITADTAETAKAYNDATVFSFFGIYEMQNAGVSTGQYGLHWLDCVELRIEPKDLQEEFMSFWHMCGRHSKPPMIAAIEKKSTGVTLVSALKEIRGMQIRDIERTRASGSKTQRFLETQPYIASKFVSLPRDGKHTKLCLDHMAKITANDSHRWDDIADTLCDAVRIALIDKTLTIATISSTNYSDIAKSLYSAHSKVDRLKKAAYTR
jgi:predicted phage terminase large subunit-like protein